jgi:hypothetical protein
MSEPTLKLQRNADELLREFPATEPDFEAQAQAIQARLKGSPGGMVFDDWLKVPELPAEPGEQSLQSSVRSAAPKSNFAEMARKSVQKKDDSVEIAKELLAATAQSRRPNAEMVERVRAAGRPAATSTPLPTSERTADEAERASGVVARAATTVRPAAAPAGASNRGVVIGIAGGLLALAACVALVVRSSDEDSRTSAALAAQKAADAPAAAAAKPQAAAAPVAKPNDGVVSPEALAAAPAPAAAGHEEAKAVALKGGGMPAAAAGAKSAPAASVGAKQEAVVLEDDPQPAQAAAAAPVEHKAEPAAEPPLKPAEGNTGSVPLNPSAGAISTALGGVRGSAQACLAGQTDPVTATVTFGADGHVLRVSAGGPSGACIQAALSKAHIAPFAKESYSASTTIRPP